MNKRPCSACGVEIEHVPWFPRCLGCYQKRRAPISVLSRREARERGERLIADLTQGIAFAASILDMAPDELMRESRRASRGASPA